MFVPVTSTSRNNKEIDRKLGAHHEARETREATAKARYQSETRAQEAQRNLSRTGMGLKAGGGKLSSAYDFDDDDEDRAAEAKIDDNLSTYPFLLHELEVMTGGQKVCG
jgi:hypothetical protein